MGDWGRIRELFDAALDLDPDARQAYLDRELPAGDDPDGALRREVEELLAADATDRDTDVVIHGLISSEFSGMEVARAGQEIGGYKILKVLGTGGMSTVFLAEQEHPHREVALKTMLLGMLSDKASRRFETESEILGRLRHPAIAQVYEAGTWQEPLAGKDVPFFAMEYVEGAQPLDVYVREAGLDLPAMVRLFLEVCEAVQYGHQLGVIHRDLKPANILVDAEGRPKIIDFGIARATDVDVAGLTMQTQTGHVLGTLQYMPPEQLDGLPDEIDTRADVYALGVIFYELLAGRPPFDPVGQPLTTFTRTVRDTDSELPSRLEGGFDLQGLARELDWISRKAIAADKRERYQSVSEFAADLRRYLANEPVSVGPPSTAYHLRKFVRRNKGLVASAAVVVTVLLVGIVATTWFWLEAEDRRAEAELQEGRAVAAKQRAERQVVKARTINEFYTELLKFADPAEGRYRSRPDWTIREALDASAESWFERLAQDPDVEAHVRLSMGNAYKSLEELKKADKHLTRAVELRRQTLGPDDPDLADAILSLAVTKSAQRKREEAIALYGEALPIFRAAYGEMHEKVAVCNLNIGTATLNLGKAAEAEARIREALAIYRKLPGNNLRFEASCLPHLGTAAFRQGRGAEAIAYYREALELYERSGREWHPHAGASRAVLAQLLERVEKDHDSAVAQMEKAREIYRKAYGEDAKATGRMHESVGDLNFRLCRYSAAVPAYASAERVYAKSYPRGAPRTTRMRGVFAVTLRALGRKADALAVAQRGYDDAVAVHGKDGAALRVIALELARCLRVNGHYDEAERVLRDRLPVARRSDKERTRLLLESELVRSLAAKGDVEAAGEIVARIWPRAQKLYGEQPNVLAVFQRTRGLFLQKRRMFEAAAAELQRALAAFEAVYPKAHINVQTVLRDLVGLYGDWQKPAEQQRYQARLDAR